MNTYEKKEIIAKVNYANKSCWRYDYKTDLVVEDYDKSYSPMKWEEWYSKFVNV